MKLLFFILLTTACTRLKTVSPGKLELKALSGEWHSENKSWLHIYCTGVMNFEINTYYFPIFWEPWKHSGSGDYISEIHENHFRVEPFGRTYKVDKWPYQDGEKTKMILEGRTWIREKALKCQ